MAKRLYIQTYGCQMNDHDSERMAGLLVQQGYRLADRMDEADLILMNTCSIREKAEQKAYSELGRIYQLQQQRPDLIVGVAGCTARQEGAALLKRLPWLRLVFGSKQIDRLPRLLDETLATGRAIIAVEDPEGVAPTIPAERKAGVRAWVSIMEGCENHCSFCVVPHTRGRERSRVSGEILEEIRGLVAQGYREVTLLGQNVNSYGRTSSEGIDFSDLLRMVDGIEGLSRIRFMTSHPSAVTDRMIQALTELPRVCEHLHLPLQSGSDAVLARMARDYTRDDYRRSVLALRRAVPRLALTTDLIVGFPGETAREFEETLDAIREFQFANLFAFKYSPRPNTPALSLDGQVDEAVKDQRLHQLLALQQTLTLARRRALIGTDQELLVDGPSRGRPGWVTGRTRTSEQVHLRVPEHRPDELTGRVVLSTITAAHHHLLEGQLH